MNFLGSGAAHHSYNLSAGCTANDGVVNQNHSLTFKQIVNGVKFQPNSKIANALLRFNERTTDIVIANEAEAEGNASFFCVTQSGGYARVRHRHNHVRGHVRFASELSSHAI